MHKAPKKIKIGGESWVARAASVPKALQNQQLRRHESSRTCQTRLLCKIVFGPSNRTSACVTRKFLEDGILGKGGQTRTSCTFHFSHFEHELLRQMNQLHISLICLTF